MAIDLFTVGPFTVHGYGLMIGLGFLAALFVGCLLCRKRGLSDNDFVNIALCVLIFGFMGGKLLYIIVNFSRFIADPMGVIGSEGFVVYGGVITGILSIWIYCRIKKLKFLEYIDVLAPAVALNQAFGRVGCFLAGCCYGRQTDSAIGVIFPEGCIAPAGVKLLPTQLFMAGGDLILCVFLLIMLNKKLRLGMVTAYYLFFYSIGRFVVEFFRNDAERGTVGVLSTSQFIGLIIAALAVIFWIYLMMRKPDNSSQQ